MLSDENQCKLYNRNDEKDVECTICFINIKDDKKIELECNHKFHIMCLYKWYNKSHTCPICRYNIELKIEKVYNMRKKGRGMQYLVSYKGYQYQTWIAGSILQREFNENNSVKVH
jgi:hypothetical protein